MSAPRLEAVEQGYQLTGAVTVDTAPALLQALSANDTKDVVIDFSELAASDSSLLALLLAWTRQCDRQSANLKCVNVPADVSSLIHLYGLESILEH